MSSLDSNLYILDSLNENLLRAYERKGIVPVYKFKLFGLGNDCVVIFWSLSLYGLMIDVDSIKGLVSVQDTNERWFESVSLICKLKAQ